jgi:hypothetical protein
MIKYTIPQPCHEDWNKMTLTTQGAFCNSCQKNVIDFTALSDAEILNFLKNNLHKETCGRIEVKQLERVNLQIDENILYTNISLWKKYLAIILICFGTMIMGCNNKVENKLQTLGGMDFEVLERIDKNDSVIKPPLPIGQEIIRVEPLTLTGVMIMPEPPPPVIAGGISFEYVKEDTVIVHTDTAHKTTIEKINDTIIKSKDSIGVKLDSCTMNSYTKL